MGETAARYFGPFCKLVKEDDGDVMTPDQNAVRIGVPMKIVHEVHVTQRGKEYDRVYVNDSTGRPAGFLSKQLTKQVVSLFDQGWLCHAVPTLVVYDKKEGGYWAEVALICYPAEYKSEFDAYVKTFCKKVAAGNHPVVSLSEEQIDQVLESGGTWSDIPNAPLPHINKDSAVYKSKQTSTEKLANTAIEHTTGCYIVLIAATVLVVALAVWFFFLR